MVSASPVLLRIQEMVVGTGKMKSKSLVLFDPGSTATLITHDLAKKLGLEGIPMTYFLKVVGQGYTKKETRAYQVILVDKKRRNWRVNLLGIDTITSVETEVDLSDVRASSQQLQKRSFIVLLVRLVC